MQLLEDSGYDETATKLTDGIRLQATEPPLTLDDHDAILAALGSNCPPGLSRLRRDLLDELSRRRQLGL